MRVRRIEKNHTKKCGKPTCVCWKIFKQRHSAIRSYLVACTHCYSTSKVRNRPIKPLPPAIMLPAVASTQKNLVFLWPNLWRREGRGEKKKKKKIQETNHPKRERERWSRHGGLDWKVAAFHVLKSGHIPHTHRWGPSHSGKQIVLAFRISREPPWRDWKVYQQQEKGRGKRVKGRTLLEGTFAPVCR